MTEEVKQPNFEFSYIESRQVVHLSGGLRGGVYADGHLVIYPTCDGEVLEFPEAKDASEHRAILSELGLQFVGLEMVHEKDGLEHSQWHPYETGENDATMIWSGVSHAAASSSDPQLEKLVRKIWFSINASSLRLRDVSQAYHRQNQLAIGREINPSTRFSNVETFDLYMSLHSALVEMCSARDYLAQFIAKRVLKNVQASTMGELYKKLKSLQQPHSLAEEIQIICNKKEENGWLARLGQFRDIIVHETPISGLNDELGMKAKVIDTGATLLHAIIVSIPRDPIAQDDNFVDALSYIRFSYARLSDFSKRVANASGLSTDIPVITDADLA